MNQKLEIIINELRAMREDLQGMGESLLPSGELLDASVAVASHYEPTLNATHVVVPVADMGKLVAAIAAVRQ